MHVRIQCPVWRKVKLTLILPIVGGRILVAFLDGLCDEICQSVFGLGVRK